MEKQIIALLQENNKLLKEISAKLSTSTQSSSLPMGDIIMALGKQYIENPEIIANENAQAYVSNDNLFIVSPSGRINVNLSEKNDKSSFIEKMYVRNNVLYVNFKSNKTYKYTSKNKELFSEVVDALMSASRVSKPFINLIRNNPEFSYAQV
jgi:hypothetical protein